MKKKNDKKSWIISAVMLVAFVSVMVFAICGFSGMVKNIDGEMAAKTPDAILASAAAMEAVMAAAMAMAAVTAAAMVKIGRAHV